MLPQLFLQLGKVILGSFYPWRDTLNLSVHVPFVGTKLAELIARFLLHLLNISFKLLVALDNAVSTFSKFALDSGFLFLNVRWRADCAVNAVGVDMNSEERIRPPLFRRIERCVIEYRFLIGNFTNCFLPTTDIIAEPLNERVFLPLKQLVQIGDSLVDGFHLMLHLTDVGFSIVFEFLALQFRLMDYLVNGA